MKQFHSRFIVPPPLLLIRSYLRQGDGRYGFHDTAHRVKLLCLVWMIADFAHAAVCAPARPGALPLHRGCTYVASATFWTRERHAHLHSYLSDRVYFVSSMSYFLFDPFTPS